MRGWHKARTMNLQDNGYDLEETLPRSSKSENDDKHHHELWRHSIMKIRKVEPTMKRI